MRNINEIKRLSKVLKAGDGALILGDVQEEIRQLLELLLNLTKGTLEYQDLYNKIKELQNKSQFAFPPPKNNSPDVLNITGDANKGAATGTVAATVTQGGTVGSTSGTQSETATPAAEAAKPAAIATPGEAASPGGATAPGGENTGGGNTSGNNITTPAGDENNQNQTDQDKKDKRAKRLKNAAGGWSLIGEAANVASNFIPDTTNTNNMGSEQADNLALKDGMDTAYDSIASAVSGFAPVGTIIGGAMMANKFISKGVQALGGGTDGMTKTDAVLSSSFMLMTPLGLVNGFGGLRTRSFEADSSVLAAAGSSYGGSVSNIQDAMTKQGKKYGLFSRRAREKADDAIAEAERLQNRMRDITDEANEQRMMASTLSDRNASIYRNITRGGYNAKYFRAARLGMKFNKTFKLITEAEDNIPQFNLSSIFNINTQAEERVPQFQSGNTFKLITNAENNKPSFKLSNDDETNDSEYQEFLNTLPYNLREPNDNYRMYRFWELNGKPKNFYEGIYLEMFSKEKDGWHGNSIAYDNENDVYEFIKTPNHKSVWMEEAAYNGYDVKVIPGMPDDCKREHYNLFKKEGEDWDEMEKFRTDYELVKEEPFWKYVRRKPTKHKEGGKLTSQLKNEEQNLIPVGALHKELHHIDNVNDITRKGIPVISNSGDLQAEIEKNELVINLEVTKFIEDKWKTYRDENTSQSEKDKLAIEVGRELVYLIFNNTQDELNFIKNTLK